MAYTVTVSILMAYIVIADTVTASTVIAIPHQQRAVALYSNGLHSHGLDRYGACSYGRQSPGLDGHGGRCSPHHYYTQPTPSLHPAHTIITPYGHGGRCSPHHYHTQPTPLSHPAHTIITPYGNGGRTSRSSGSASAACCPERSGKTCATEKLKIKTRASGRACARARTASGRRGGGARRRVGRRRPV